MKISKILFILTGFGFILTACSGDEKPTNSTIISKSVEISIRDMNGNDLLDPQNPNAYIEDEIKVFYLVNGVPEEVLWANMDHSRGFNISNRANEYRIAVFLNDNENQPITYIQWNGTDADTLRAEFRRWDNGIEVRKVWFNDVLRWEFSDGDSYFEIMK